MSPTQISKLKTQNSLLIAALCLLLSACGGPSYNVRVIDSPSQAGKAPTQKPYEVNGERYHPIATANGYVEEGIASWYGSDFHGRKTSNGETYDMYAMTAAHKTLPMNVSVRVTNLRNGRSTVVRINDRGPFVRGRIIDLSQTAAKQLDIVGPGTAPVRIEALGYLEESPGGKVASYRQPQTYQAGQFMVQVGAFTVADNAYRLAARLKAQYGNSAVVEGWVAGQKYYRVRAGLYNTLDLAAAALQQFESGGYPNCFVVAKE